jgi:hypothetical protein
MVSLVPNFLTCCREQLRSYFEPLQAEILQAVDAMTKRLSQIYRKPKVHLFSLQISHCRHADVISIVFLQALTQEISSFLSCFMPGTTILWK